MRGQFEMIENEFFIFNKGVLTFKPGIEHIEQIMINGPHNRPLLPKIHKIIMPDDVVEINHHAFSGLCNLNEIILSNNLRKINSYAFENTGIEMLKIPDSVTLIGTKCFAASKIQNIELSKNLKHLGVHAFYRCRNLENIIIPKNVIGIPDACFACCDKLKSITFLGDVEIFNKDVFYNCKQLEKFVFPKSTKRLGFCIFSGCDNLKYVEINGPVNTIPAGAFLNCYNLRTIVLSDTVKCIDDIFEFGYDASKLTIKCNGKGDEIRTWAKLNGIRFASESEISTFLNTINEGVQNDIKVV